MKERDRKRKRKREREIENLDEIIAQDNYINMMRKTERNRDRPIIVGFEKFRWLNRN